MVLLHPKHRMSDFGLDKLFSDIFPDLCGAERAISDFNAGFGRDNTFDEGHPQYKVYEQTFDILEKQK